MLNLAPMALLMSGLLLCLLVGPLSAQSCTSCGPECVSACGSRRYRTCCFNYLRKRRSPVAPGAPPSEQLGLDMYGQDGLQGLQGLPDDLRLQLVVVPNDQDGQESPAPNGLTQSLLHRLLEAQGADRADAQAGDRDAIGGGSVEATNAPPAGAAPPPASSQRRRPGSGTGPALGAVLGAGAAGKDKDWLNELRHRVGLVYNV